MVASCCIAFCKSYCKRRKPFLDDKGNVISFHEIPSEIGMREKWLSIISRRDFIPTDSTKVCSLHFREDDFVQGLKNRRLKAGVVPTILPGYPSYKVPKIKEHRRTIKKHPITQFSRKSMHVSNSYVEVKNRENIRNSLHKPPCKQSNIKCIEIEEGTSVDGTPLFDIVCVKNKYVPPLTISVCPAEDSKTYVDSVKLSLGLNSKCVSSRNDDSSDTVSKNGINQKSKTCIPEICEEENSEFIDITNANFENFSDCSSKVSDDGFFPEERCTNGEQAICGAKLKKLLNKKEMHCVKLLPFSEDLNDLQEFYVYKKKDSSVDNSVFYKALAKILNDVSTKDTGHEKAHALLQQIENYGKLQ